MIKPNKLWIFLIAPAVLLLVMGCNALQTPTIKQEITPTPVSESTWQEEFNLPDCSMLPNGSNDYFILEPGFQIILEGATEKVVITVLDETKTVDGIETRVIEEREWKNGELIEISRNFYSFCKETKDVYYFGEEVDMISNGEVVSHSGQWLAGVDGAKAGLMMPGSPVAGMRYYQEIAPGVAMDRAEILSTTYILETPAGSFENSVRTQEGTALNLLEIGYKTYAPGIGLIQDANTLLMEYGFTNSK